MPVTHTTKISQTNDASRIVTTQSKDGVLANTRIEIRPATRGLFHVTIEQLERLPRHKRGLSRSVSFVISRAGIDHLCGVEA